MIRAEDTGLMGGINIAIRQAVPSDTAIVSEFNLKLARETEQLELDSATVNAGVGAVLRDPGKGFYFLAEAEGGVVGQVMITYEWSDWRNGQIWWLQSVYVSERFRNRGVFRSLFAHLSELAARTPGVWGLRLYMHEANTIARGTYARLGMAETHYRVFELDVSGGGGT